MNLKGSLVKEHSRIHLFHKMFVKIVFTNKYFQEMPYSLGDNNILWHI